jgi:hypothetical protein
LPDVGVVGDYFAVAALFMEGGGQLQPVPGVDYMAESGLLSLGSGQAAVGLELILVPAGGPVAGTNSGFASPSLER